MSNTEQYVRFGAELTFDRVRGGTRAKRTTDSSAPPPSPVAPSALSAIRTAPELTVTITEAHERTVADVFGLLDHILEDRTDRFDGVHIALNRAVSDEQFVDALEAYSETARSDLSVTYDVVDSYYSYDPDRLLVTPDRYTANLRSDGDILTSDSTVDSLDPSTGRPDST